VELGGKLNVYLDFTFFVIGLLISYTLINWRYKKEMKIRLKWINKRLKKGKWKFPLALFFVLYISSVFINLIFSMVSNDFIFKPFFISFFFILFFMLFFFKLFYEIIGGKREWKM